MICGYYNLQQNIRLLTIKLFLITKPIKVKFLKIIIKQPLIMYYKLRLRHYPKLKLNSIMTFLIYFLTNL
jgi:hypothetical protein